MVAKCVSPTVENMFTLPVSSESIFIPPRECVTQYQCSQQTLNLSVTDVLLILDNSVTAEKMDLFFNLARILMN